MPKQSHLKIKKIDSVFEVEISKSQLPDNKKLIFVFISVWCCLVHMPCLLVHLFCNIHIHKNILTELSDVRRGNENRQRIPESHRRIPQLYIYILIDRSKQSQTKARLSIQKKNKTVQSVIAGSKIVPAAVEKLNKKFEELNWRNTFGGFCKCAQTND